MLRPALVSAKQAVRIVFKVLRRNLVTFGGFDCLHLVYGPRPYVHALSRGQFEFLDRSRFARFFILIRNRPDRRSEQCLPLKSSKIFPHWSALLTTHTSRPHTLLA